MQWNQPQSTFNANTLPMQIVFINYYHYIASSGVHIHFIANELTQMGHECTVVLPEVKGTDVFGPPLYSFRGVEEFVGDLDEGRFGSDTILHAWTPREASRIVTQLAASVLGSGYFVHMEDNERRILEHAGNKTFKDLVKEAAHGAIFEGSHPLLHQIFLAEASGVSVLMDKLAQFVPSGVPTQLIWPACEKEFFHLPPQPNLQLRKRLGIPGNASVIVYPGNIHQANVETIDQLYRALPLVEAAGHEIRLVRCAGHDYAACPDVKDIIRRYVVAMPDLPSKKLAEWISMSDVLVQPGVPDEFDEYRFPSKLPMFLASGRPLALSRANLGRFLQDGENCLILEENTPEVIAGKIVWLLEHPAEAAAIAHNGRKFAAQNFNWTKTAKTLLDFYAANAHGRI